MDAKHVAMGIKQAWNIKNYRYVGDVSPALSTLAREGSEALPGTLPERGIITGGFFIAVAASHDEEGVVLHRG